MLNHIIVIQFQDRQRHDMKSVEIDQWVSRFSNIPVNKIISVLAIDYHDEMDRSKSMRNESPSKRRRRKSKQSSRSHR